MKIAKYASALTLGCTLLLCSCSGSEAYRGEWKAVGTDGAKAEITFAEKSFTVKDEAGAQTVYEYTQNAFRTENGRTSYGIDVKNGSQMQIIFPFKGNAERAAIAAPDDSILYTLDRSQYVPADKFWQLPR